LLLKVNRVWKSSRIVEIMSLSEGLGAETEDLAMGGAQAIRRAMRVIRAVAQIQRTGATLSRIAALTALSSSTAHRILHSLTEERMLRQDGATKRFFLGPLAFELGLAAQAEHPVGAYWRETIERLAERTRLTSYLMVRSDCEAVCFICVQGSAVIRAVPMEPGQRLPLGIGAGSLAMLAALDDAEIMEVMALNEARLKAFPGEAANRDAIWERVRTTRELGFALSAGSVSPGVVGIGVPVPPEGGLMQLAISVSAVVETMDPDEARRIASLIGEEINNRLSKRSDIEF